MTKDHSDPHHATPAEPEHPAPLETTASPTPTAEESPVMALQAAESVKSHDFSPAIPAELPEPFGMTAAFFVDASPLAQKSLEIWDENLNAMMAYMESLAGVKTIEEAVALQTRFATERFETFGRQSRDLVALAQQLASIGVAPLCDTRAAA